MSEQEKQENQKTIVAFAAGLLVGGLLVWIFGGSPKSEKLEDQQMNSATTTQSATSTATDASSSNSGANSSTTGSNTSKPAATVAKPVLQTGEGKVSVADQKAGTSVKLESATFPTDEGWIGVRDYQNGQLGSILGVARFSKSQGLVPQQIELQRATKAGSTYAIVFYSENGDRVFNLAKDAQQGGIMTSFKAQ